MPAGGGVSSVRASPGGRQDRKHRLINDVCGHVGRGVLVDGHTVDML